MSFDRLSIVNYAPPSASFTHFARRLERIGRRTRTLFRRPFVPFKNRTLPSTARRSRDNPLRRWSPVYISLFIIGSTAFDVFVASSLHLWRPIDDGVHRLVVNYVAGNVDPLLLDPCLSDFGFVLCLAIWIAVDVMEAQDVPTLFRNAFKGLNPKLVAAIVANEALVGVMKNVFRRRRPRLDLTSFSFPSGHTSAAFVLGGVVLFFKLRPYLKRNKESSMHWLTSESVTTVGWLSIGILTAVGRIACDAHWFSDTVAGAALGAAVFGIVSLTVDDATDTDQS